MHLKAVELRDWRSYRHARFEFPGPIGEKNVLLVRGPNEHGKTSFFEAIVLGLYGRDGLFLVPRARVALNGEATERQAVTYSQFLNNVLHRRAISQGRQSCSVNLEFEDNDGEPLSITRKWHFAANGQHKLYDDELIIFEGRARRPLTPPSIVTDKESWYRDYIAQNFLPPHLAEFFLFDGEQVQRYASRGMANQVRLGIEGLLGLPILKSLKESLLRYSQNRRTSAATPSDETIKSVESSIAGLEKEIEHERKRLTEANSLLPNLESESDEVLSQLGGGKEVTMAMVADLIREEERYRNEAERVYETLINLIAEDLSLALSGRNLRNETIKRLCAEDIRENWQSGCRQGSANLDKYLLDLSKRLSAFDVLFKPHQIEKVTNEAKEAWHSLWHPEPSGCAESFLHSGLMSNDRQRAISRLAEVDSHTMSEIDEILNTFNSSVEMAETKKKERLTLEQRAPEAERLSSRLKDVSQEIGRLRSQRSEATRSIESLEGQLASKRQELGRYTDKVGKGAPALQKASKAELVIKLIDDVLDGAIPTQVKLLSDAMSMAWKSMAHMSDRVERIEITPDCRVKMLNSKNEDLHEIEKSAGASQVFTQALIWAVTHVSGHDFPFIVDTPLARLSREQRLGVLKTFTDRNGQVILLSTDEEVIDDKYELIKHKILSSYELHVRNEDGISITTVEKNET